MSKEKNKKEIKDISSYHSAMVFPKKILHDQVLINNLWNGKVIPRSAQIAPTNRCDLKCSYCCCDKVDRKQEMTFEMFKDVVDTLKKIGVESVIITGGGEPLLHKNILDMINYCRDNDIEVGLISNGNHYTDEMIPTLSKLTWGRISFDDNRKLTSNYLNSIRVCNSIPNVTWSFSYVVTSKPNLDNLKFLVNFVNLNENFDHIRIVNDSLDETTDTNVAREFLKKEGIDDSRCFYKVQQNYKQGMKKCYLSLLKPRVTADGKIFGCCGTQYQKLGNLKGYSDKFSLGHYKDLPKLIEDQQYFNGLLCDKCYYTNYNDMLDAWLSIDKLTHLKFL